jgi:formate hydrogenlyase subunit 3/multisubunit Na+/H+ antiporter MnhD subunit
VTLYLLAIGVLVSGGTAAFALSRRPAAALAAGSAAGALGCAIGLVPAVVALGSPATSLDLGWSAPHASLALGLDPLSAIFAVVIFALGLAASVFGAGYLRSHLGRRSLGAFLFFFDLLLASMALVVAARQALLFLAAWEAMSVSSFLLVAFEHQEARVRDAARVYLFASHLAVVFLFALFVLLGRGAGSLRFDALVAAAGSPAAPAALLFVLALVGFGTKAGLVPLHVWLPDAHPAAPSHVSALMSGALVKMGIYGLLRALSFLPPPPAWWGILLAALGLAGALAALRLALGQRDVKRVLAYSTVENVGLVALGLGLALAGAALGLPALAALGIAGALLHVWNHAAMKGLAFLAAGAIVHGAGTRDLERMGGLLRRLPAAGTALLLGAAALSALPPLNGFASEWLLYLGLAEGGRGAGAGPALATYLALAALAVVGGLAAIVFTRLVGVALLGTPRSEGAASAHGGGPLLAVPLLALGAACLAVAIFPGRTLSLLLPAAAQVLRASPRDLGAALAPAAAALEGPMRAGLALLVAAVAIGAVASRRLLARREVSRAETWGCGFSAPSARMQYTAASYAQLAVASAVPRPLRPRRELVAPEGVLPADGAARLALDGADPARTRLFEPALLAVADRFARLRRLQQGRLDLQLVYTVATLLLLGVLLLLHERLP